MPFELYDVWKSNPKSQTRDKFVLAGATVALPVGRKIALLGPDRECNAGVLRVMSGVDEPEKGIVRRVGVSCWPFDYSGFEDNSGSLQQNANFIANVYGVEAGEVARIATILSGVRIVRGKPLKQYLVPERKAILLGLTLALQFDWYFVDQKLPSGPPASGELVDAALADRLGRASVVWATTVPESLDNYCDAGLVLDQGRLTFYDDMGAAVAAYRRSTDSEASTTNERKSRHSNRRRRTTRRARKNDSEKSG